MKFNKPMLILAYLLVCFTFQTLICHEVINAQKVENEPEKVQNLGFISNLKSVFENTRDFLGQKLGQLYGRFDLAKVATFDMFTKLYNKRYSTLELPRRMKLFFERKRQVEESQQLYKQGKVLFEMKLNQFADLDNNEMKSIGSGLRKLSRKKLEEELSANHHESNEDGLSDEDDEVKESSSSQNQENMTRLLAKIPISKDWRETDCISNPIDQKNCGSCYAISTMSMVSAMLCLKGFSEKPYDLSPQQIIDCAKKNYFNDEYYNEGCKVGWPSSVLRYLQEEGVALKEHCYPYASMENTDCLSKRLMTKKNCTVRVDFSSEELPYKVISGERSILYHVAEIGPVVVTVYSTKEFKLYGSGIYEDKDCNEENYNYLGTHAILIVGYGQEKGVDYWIIKNSWGTDWGEGGYGKIRRGANVCNIGSIGWVISTQL